MIRIIVDLILIVCVFIFPWWVAALLMVVAAFIFSTFYEMLFLGIVLDSLYNAPISLGHFHFTVTISMIIIFCIAEILKRQLRFYGQR